MSGPSRTSSSAGSVVEPPRGGEKRRVASSGTSPVGGYVHDRELEAMPTDHLRAGLQLSVASVAWTVFGVLPQSLLASAQGASCWSPLGSPGFSTPGGRPPSSFTSATLSATRPSRTAANSWACASCHAWPGGGWHLHSCGEHSSVDRPRRVARGAIGRGARDDLHRGARVTRRSQAPDRRTDSEQGAARRWLALRLWLPTRHRDRDRYRAYIRLRVVVGGSLSGRGGGLCGAHSRRGHGSRLGHARPRGIGDLKWIWCDLPPGRHVPASFQLVGPSRSDEILFATVAHVEAALHATT